MSKSSCTSASIFSQVSLFPAGLLLLLLLTPTLLADKVVVVNSDSPLHAKLASIEEGGYLINQSDIDTGKVILDRLSGKCSQDSRDKVGSLIITAHKILKDRGKKMKLREAARILDESIPPEGAGLLDCGTLFSTTVTREATGMSRLKLDKAPY